MDFEQIVEKHGKIIWTVSKRYKIGIWAAEDINNQLIVMVYSAMKSKILPTGTDEKSTKRVRSFVISKAISIVRREKLRRMLSLVVDSDSDDGTEVQVEFKKMSVPAILCEIDHIKEFLDSKLTERDSRFIMELVFPSPEVIDIVTREAEQAKQDEAIRMNIHNPDVLPKHVAEYMKTHFGYKITPVISHRIIAKARKALCELIGGRITTKKNRNEEKRESKIDDIINELLGE